jgi:hypothetical protein
MRGRSVAAAIAIAFLAGASPPLSAGPIAAHRAIYDITLARASPGSAVQGVSGKMALDVRTQCDTITVNQVFQSDYWGADSRPKHSALKISSVESLDGASLRFSMHNEVEGAGAEAFQGTALRGDGTQPGSVRYSDAVFPETSLPEGTMFPSAHLVRLISAAAAGERNLAANVFDGSERGKVYRATAIIGARGKARGTVPEALSQVAHWPVTIGYFSRTTQEPMPDYEMSFDLYANGVSAALLIDYGRYAIRAELVALELLPETKCAGR